MTLKLIAIGALGNMLGPSAKHLLNSDCAKYIRVLDRGAPGAQKDALRKDWQVHGATSVTTLKELIGDGDFDGVVICAGKNGDDYQIFRELVPLLTSQKHFVLHCSTVSCQFVQATHTYCAQHHIHYANYPLTGGAKGAVAGTMLVLCSGDENFYHKLEPMLSKIGKPKYFGERIDLAAGVKLIGHVLVFHGLLGMSLAVSLQKQLFGFSSINKQQVEFFDFLTQGAGGMRQWEVAVRPGVADDNWTQGFLVPHAVIDALYTAQLMQEQQLPVTLILPLLEVALLMAYVLQHNTSEQPIATQSVTRLIANTDKKIVDEFVKQYLSLDIEVCFKNCVSALPEKIQQTLMLEVKY